MEVNLLNIKVMESNLFLRLQCAFSGLGAVVVRASEHAGHGTCAEESILEGRHACQGRPHPPQHCGSGIPTVTSPHLRPSKSKLCSHRVKLSRKIL